MWKAVWEWRPAAGVFRLNPYALFSYLRSIGFAVKKFFFSIDVLTRTWEYLLFYRFFKSIFFNFRVFCYFIILSLFWIWLFFSLWESYIWKSYIFSCFFIFVNIESAFLYLSKSWFMYFLTAMFLSDDTAGLENRSLPL